MSPVLRDRVKLKLPNPGEIRRIPGLPEIIIVLHGQPTLRRPAYRFGQAQRHLRTHCASLGDNTCQGRSSDAQILSQRPDTDIELLDICLTDKFARVRWVINGSPRNLKRTHFRL